MAAVHIPSLPRFSGQPQDLPRFFDEFEAYAVAAGYFDDMDKIGCVTRYAVDMKTQRLWDRLPQSMDRDWSAFRAAVENLPPEPADDPCYSVSSLETLCRNRSQSIPTARLKEDFDLFHAEFIAIASYLQDRNLIFEQELKKLYISAFDTPTQQKIHAAIFKLKPFHYPGRLYPADYIHELTTSAFETNSSIHTETPTSSSSQPLTPSPHLLDAATIQDMINKTQQETIATLTQFISDAFQQVLVTFLRAQNTSLTSINAKRFNHRNSSITNAVFLPSAQRIYFNLITSNVTASSCIVADHSCRDSESIITKIITRRLSSIVARLCIIIETADASFFPSV
ncbi:hypothetical protein ONZ45_g5034 [Pleurotus djamor]|nr:hypothetical protein ONZ45_g5034 [Pleurotus djamor]